MTLGDDHAQLTRGPADVANGSVVGEVETLGEGTGGIERDPRHRVHELLQAVRIAVQLFEQGSAAVFDLVLRLSGLQRLGEVSPEPVEPAVEHFQQAADVGRLVGVEELRGVAGVAILAAWSVAVSLQKSHCDETVEEVVYRP